MCFLLVKLRGKFMSAIDRREFLQSSTLAAAAVLASRLHVSGAQAESPSEQISAGVVGLGRGLAHANAILKASNARLAYVCDLDTQRLERGMKSIAPGVEESKQELPTPIRDLRRMLDDPKLDAVFIATCNHWHAIAAIMACQAGKHVYVEKPGSHNAWEGEMLIKAARKFDRRVQMGNQRRSWPGIQAGIEKLKAGAIGKVTYARCWYHNARPSIGVGKPAPVPENIDYELWQGPAPERPFVDNLIHYNWHWRWHYGGGELANNGIHSLDVVRWGLGVDVPKSVSVVGGRYAFQDDQETPDTGAAVYDFGDVGCTWEFSSCQPRRGLKVPTAVFYGSDGELHITNSGFEIYDLQGKKTDEGNGPGGEQTHIENFLAAIKTGSPLNSEIEVGQTSTLMCHLGNISYRTGRTIHVDPTTRKILGDPEAEKYWKREYRQGWEPQV